MRKRLRTSVVAREAGPERPDAAAALALDLCTPPSPADLAQEPGACQFDQPPSMTWIVPVVNADSSLAR